MTPIRKISLERATTISLLVAVGLLLTAECLMNLTPPISRDALIHHLAVPKLWLRHGLFHEIPWAKFSYYPMNIDLLYFAALYLGTDTMPKFIHWAFGLGSGLLVYSYIKKRFNKNWGILGMAIFLTTPVVVRLSTTAYVDLGMCFFITASVLLLIEWRDHQYKETKWLVLSSCCMGLALGSKYNALVPALFMNMMVVYCYAQDTQRQLKALSYGVLFLGLSVLFASPWYIKNWILTGNPFYPLFSSLFASFQNDTSMLSAVQGGATGLFERRQILFGDSLLDTVLIPIRLFFQGKDNTYEYFDGVLNPILILFLPFSLTTKDLWKDKVLFIQFTVFVIVVTFFVTRQQVRYIVAVLPLLSILAAIGIKNVFSWIASPVFRSTQMNRDRPGNFDPVLRWASCGALVTVIVLLLSFNAVYLKEKFQHLNPMNYILQRETKDAFLTRHLGSYQAMHFINENTPDSATIFFLFVGNRGYYLDRAYYHEPSFGMKTLRYLIASSDNPQAFLSRLKSLSCTHILARDDLCRKFLADNFQEEQISAFFAVKERYWKKVFESGGFTVYDVSSAT